MCTQMCTFSQIDVQRRSSRNNSSLILHNVNYLGTKADKRQMHIFFKTVCGAKSIFQRIVPSTHSKRIPS